MSNRNNDEEESYVIATLIEDLKNEDVLFRLNSIKRLPVIAKALGPDRTRTELLPFVTESCMDDEDEILLSLAEILGDFSELVGVKKSESLLVPLGALCNVEENAVREKAVDSLKKIASKMKAESVETHFLPLLKALANGEWFTSRASSCGLFPILYKSVSVETETKLRRLYSKLCKDDTPMVRRSAFKHLGVLAGQLSKQHVTTGLIPIFLSLSQDAQDSVRLLSVRNCVEFAKLLDKDEKKKFILPVVKKCVNDKSWKVRYMVAENFKNLCSSLGGEVTNKELLSDFVKLSKDIETEVRTEVALRIADVCSLVSKEKIISDILPGVKLLVFDKSEHVRSALGTVIMGIAPRLEKEATTKYLLPFFLQLLKDQYPDVRLNIISKLDDVNKVIGIELLSKSLLSAIIDLAEDKQWRVRLAIIEYMPLLSSELGEKFFNENLSELCMTWLSDSVYSIREAAVKILKQLTKIFGSGWAEKHVLPEILGLRKKTNYLYRMTTLLAISSLAEVLKEDVLTDKVLKVVIDMADDSVPNIKFNVAKTLQDIIPFVKPKVVQGSIKSCLQKLKKDKDPDVIQFANQALSKC